MGTLKWARMAIAWLVKKAKLIKANRVKIREVTKMLAEGTKYQLQVERFFEKVAKIEATVGATTTAWKMIGEAKPGEDIVLPAAEVRYLKEFKKAFDQTLKK